MLGWDYRERVEDFKLNSVSPHTPSDTQKNPNGVTGEVTTLVRKFFFSPSRNIHGELIMKQHPDSTEAETQQKGLIVADIWNISPWQTNTRQDLYVCKTKMNHLKMLWGKSCFTLNGIYCYITKLTTSVKPLIKICWHGTVFLLLIGTSSRQNESK